MIRKYIRQIILVLAATFAVACSPPAYNAKAAGCVSQAHATTVVLSFDMGQGWHDVPRLKVTMDDGFGSELAATNINVMPSGHVIMMFVVPAMGKPSWIVTYKGETLFTLDGALEACEEQ